MVIVGAVLAFMGFCLLIIELFESRRVTLDSLVLLLVGLVCMTISLLFKDNPVMFTLSLVGAIVLVLGVVFRYVRQP